MKIWRLLAGMLMVAQLGFAAPQLIYTEHASAGGYTATLNRYEDDEILDEDCGEYALVDFSNPTLHFHDRQKFCAGGLLEGFQAGKQVVFFIQRIGGSGAGWSLYRYNPIIKKVDFYDFYAREIHIQKVGKGKTTLNVHYARHKLVGMGYDQDRITKWVWADGAPSPTQIK